MINPVAILLAALAGLHSANAQAEFTLLQGPASARSEGGEFTLTGAIGQSSAGSSSGGDFSIEGGVVPDETLQSIDEPMLQIDRFQGIIRIAWPAHHQGFAIETSTDLREWTRTSDGGVIQGDQRVVTFQASANVVFFRLRR